MSGEILWCVRAEKLYIMYSFIFAALWNEMFLGTGYTSIQFSSLEKIELEMIGTLFTMIIYYFFVWLEVVLFLATFSCFLFHRQCLQPYSKFWLCLCAFIFFGACMKDKKKIEEIKQPNFHTKYERRAPFHSQDPLRP